MSKIAILTDANTGLTSEQARELGFYQLSLPFSMNGEFFNEPEDMTISEFFQKMDADSSIKVATSQPSAGSVMDMWDALLKEYDEIVHIPMSSGLSGTCETAKMLSEDYDGKVHVVDNQRISGGLSYAAMEAVQLVKKGWSGKQIADWLMETKFDASVYISLSTLKYLKAGGRITPAAAALGTLLRIRPILQIQGYKLDAFAKARTLAQAKSIMFKALKNDMDTRFGEKIHLSIVHSDWEEEAIRLKEEVQKEFPCIKEIDIVPLSISVSCHIGPKSLAFAIEKIHEEIWD